MAIFADILMVAGACAAGFYCWILSRQLEKFRSSDTEIGRAVSQLSSQVEDLQLSVSAAKSTAEVSQASLTGLTEKAEGVARRLELMIASLHDFKDEQEEVQTPVFARKQASGGQV